MDIRERLQDALSQTHTIEGELARGGMSRVFLATEIALNRQVVVKVLSPELGAAVNIDRFRREILMSARLQHPNIVPLLSAGEIEGQPYYIMPYVEGRSLHDRLTADEPLPLQEGVSILRDVARALGVAHERGIIHRDIKPDNILLTAGAAVVTDFGVARAVSSSRDTDPEQSHRLTGVGISLGTPAYMAPEQAAADPNADHRVDLYAWGILAYEVLGGRPPFRGDTAQSLIVAHLTEVPAPLTDVRGNVPPALSDLVMQCLAKAPEERPASAAEILRVLEDPMATGPRPRAALPRRTRWVTWAVGLTAVVLIAVVGGSKWLRGTPDRPTQPPGASLAVLPLTPIGGDTGNLYFADGMTEELTSALSRVRGLRVASRTAAFGFREGRPSIGEIGQALNVGALLEGTVRRDGDRLRVTVQLVDVRDGLTLWSERYEREMADVFAVQDDVTNAIVEALKTRLGTDAGVRMRHGTDNLAAYDLYLRGRYQFHRRGAKALQQAIRLFEGAIALDSLYAKAFAGMADAYSVLPLYSDTPVDAIVPQALRAVNRAIALDSTLAEAYASRGNLETAMWRFDAAAADLLRAIELMPQYATAHQWLGENRLIQGDVDAAVAALDRAVTLDPLSPIMAGSTALALGIAGRGAEAVAQARRAVDLDSTLMITRVMLATVHLYAGDARASVPVLEGVVADAGPVPVAQGMLGYAYARLGRTDSAEAILNAVDREAAGGLVAAARVELGLGRLDAAVEDLTAAAERRDPFFSSESMASRIFDPLRSLPGFRVLLERVGLDATRLADPPTTATVIALSPESRPSTLRRSGQPSLTPP